MIHKELDVWKKSMDLVEEIYKHTDKFPKSEVYGLSNQIRRAAVSVPSNIAEGAAKNSSKDFIKFLYIALGSLSEIETQLIISCRLKYITSIDFDNLNKMLIVIRGEIFGLINSVKRKMNEE